VLRSDWNNDPSVKEWQEAIYQKHKSGQPLSADEVLAVQTGDKPQSDPVNLPSHYTKLPVECIDVAEHFNFTLGNALKYIWRADHKGKPIEDLEKAVWYLRRELDRRRRLGE
jgi:hypothetical protein